MRILVTFAVKAEFGPWSSRHPFVPYEFENWETRRHFDLFKANIGPDEVTVLLTGMGKDSASRAMASIPIAEHDVCISSGLAGALDDELLPGTILGARAAQPFHDSAKIDSDPFLYELAHSCGAIPAAVSLTVDHVIRTAREKEELRDQSKARIVEMESAYILAAARAAHVPAVIVRAISDAADEDMPVDFSKVLDAHGHLQMGGLLKEVGLHPNRIPLLIQFGRQSRRASKSLADFLDRYIAAVSQTFTRVSSSKIAEVSAT